MICIIYNNLISQYYGKRSFIRKRLAKRNLLFIAVGVCVILTGFVLMKIEAVLPKAVLTKDVFSFRRIVVAPMVISWRILFIIFGILFNPKRRNEYIPNHCYRYSRRSYRVFCLSLLRDI